MERARAEFDRAWIPVSMALFIVALVLLLSVERDQRRAVRKREPPREEPPAAGPRPARSEPGFEPGLEPKGLFRLARLGAR